MPESSENYKGKHRKINVGDRDFQIKLLLVNVYCPSFFNLNKVMSETPNMLFVTCFLSSVDDNMGTCLLVVGDQPLTVDWDEQKKSGGAVLFSSILFRLQWVRILPASQIDLNLKAKCCVLETIFSENWKVKFSQFFLKGLWNVYFSLFDTVFSLSLSHYLQPDQFELFCFEILMRHLNIIFKNEFLFTNSRDWKKSLKLKCHPIPL